MLGLHAIYDIAPNPRIRHILLGARGQAAPQAGEVLSRDHMLDVHLVGYVTLDL